MSKTVILVDYENVQPKFGEVTLGPQYEVKVFLSRKLPKLVHPAAATEVELISTDAAGKNALDFHIVYYLGQAAAKHPDYQYVIISKDKGFDTLTAALTQAGTSIRRVNSLGELVAGAGDLAGPLFANWITWLGERWSNTPHKPKTPAAFIAYMYPQLQAAVRRKLVAGAPNLEALFRRFVQLLLARQWLVAPAEGRLSLVI